VNYGNKVSNYVMCYLLSVVRYYYCLMTNDLIVNHTALDTAIYRMSPIELKLMHYCITKVRRDGGFDDDNRHFEIHHDEFGAKIGRDNCYNSIKEAAQRLQQRIVHIKETIVDDDGTEWDGGLISVLAAQKWRGGDSTIKLSFTHEFMPYLTKLAGNYNKLFFDDIAHMKSEHSIIIYKMVRNNHNMNQKYGRDDNLLLKIDVLREALGLGGKYKTNYDFKRFVIEKAVDEINKKSPLFVEFEQVKRGRKIDAYSFKSSDKTKPLPAKSKAAKRVKSECDAIVRAFEDGEIVHLNDKLVIEISSGLVSFEDGSANLFELVKKGVAINIKNGGLL